MVLSVYLLEHKLYGWVTPLLQQRRLPITKETKDHRLLPQTSDLTLENLYRTNVIFKMKRVAH